MRPTSLPRVASLLAALIFTTSLPLEAQIPTAVGTRAQGMAGAFTAVADDASATWWNPAGLASGAYLSMVLERTRIENHEGPPDDPFHGRTSSFAVGFPALGISYYRFRVDEVRALPSIGQEPADRQEGEAIEPGIRGIAVSQYGVTVGQSLSDGVVAATTFKLLRGGELRVGDPSGGLEAAAGLDVPVALRFDMDFGVLARIGPVRLGGTLRNVTTPEFGDGGGGLELDRHVRVGLAVVGEDLAVPVNVAADMDLTETETALGDVRHFAAGLEAWLWQRRLGARGGVSVNTAGPGGEAASAGVSLMLQSGLHLDGAITRGSDKSREGWSVGLRVSY